MVGGLEVWTGRAGAVEFKWPATCLARRLILSRGPVGVRGVFPEDATVTNVTADCLHGTAADVNMENGFCKRGRTGGSHSSERVTDIKLFESIASARVAIGYGNGGTRPNRG
jgi:hypothetical protein